MSAFLGAFFDGILQLVESIKPFVYILVAVAVAGVGLSIFIKGDKAIASLKENIIYIVIGAALLILAVSIGSAIAGLFFAV